MKVELFLPLVSVFYFYFNPSNAYHINFCETEIVSDVKNFYNSSSIILVYESYQQGKNQFKL